MPIEGNLTAEVDIYEGELQGLMTTEVEFSSVEAAEKLLPRHGSDAMSARKKPIRTPLFRYTEPKGALIQSSFLIAACISCTVMPMKQTSRGGRVCITDDMIRYS